MPKAGRNGNEDNAAGTPGAAFGASLFRLVPSFRWHEGQQTRHPVVRPPAVRIKTEEQFKSVCDLLQV